APHWLRPALCGDGPSSVGAGERPNIHLHLTRFVGGISHPVAIRRKLRPTLICGCVYDRSRPEPPGKREDVDIAGSLGILSHEGERVAVGCHSARHISGNGAVNGLLTTAAVAGD